MTKTPILLACALSWMLAACSPQEPNQNPPATPASAAAGVDTVAGSDESKLTSGIDLAGIDREVRPGDDFFAYANGTWLENTAIPADRSSTGSFLVAYQRAQQRTADLIRKAGDTNPAAGSDARKIADFYAAWMDTEAIEKHGLAPIMPMLDTIDAIATREDLASVLGQRLRQDVDPLNATDYHTPRLFGLFVAQGLTDPSHNIAYLLQGGLVMPSGDYYLSDQAAMADVRASYQSYIADLLEAAGTADAQQAAARVFALESKIAEAHASLVASQDVHQANNLWPPAEFATRAPGLDWEAYFEAAGLADQKLIDVWQPQAIAGLSALAGSEPIESWKALLRFHTLDAAAELLPRQFADLHFAFHGKTLSGTPEQRERWKRAVDATSGTLGFAVGKLYVDQYFPATAKREVEAMVDNIIAAFDARLEQLAWMTPETRSKARAKLQSLTVAVGYPQHWPSYDGLAVSADNPLANAINAAKFHTRQRLMVLGKPVNDDHWWMTPQLVNAINLPLQNQLQFPAGILQPPFFVAGAAPARNYGAIGAVIGHEISHSFDNMGSQFDAEGRMRNWWSDADMQHFEAEGQRLVAQYNQYQPLPGLHLNGQQTLGENIADVSGLTAAWQAWQHSLGGKPAPVIDGLDGAERFFLAFGQTWRSKARDEALRNSISTNVHAPGHYRALTVRNLDAWYQAFDIQPDARLYLAPDERVQIW